MCSIRVLGLAFELFDLGAQSGVVGRGGLAVGRAAAGERAAERVELIESLYAALQHDARRGDVGQGASRLGEREDAGGHGRSLGAGRGNRIPLTTRCGEGKEREIGFR